MYIRCMGEIYRVRNLRICIFPKDHLPAHFHVIGPGAHAKLRISDLSVIESKGFKTKALKEIQEFLKEKKEKLMEVWNANQE